MALKQNFYTEIFEQEQSWIELINSKYLNSIYCKHQLQPFYLNKKKELEQEYFLTRNDIIKNILGIIDSIIQQIELFNEQFNVGQTVNVETLIPLFLTTQMSNTSKKENKQKDINKEIGELQVRKQILENRIRNFDRNATINDDYVYDDFLEEERRVK